MSDPTKLDASDWFAAGVAILMASIGGVMKWFYASRKSMQDEIAKTNERLDEHFVMDAQRHETQSIALKEVQVSQGHLKERLDDVKEEIQLSAERGAQAVNSQFAQLLGEIRKMKD